MAEKTEDNEDKEETPFINEPSSLDELTHSELLLMHGEASKSLLFAKSIQWRSVGSTLLVYGGCIAIAVFTPADVAFARLLTALIIVLACGVIFLLIMYQFWQFNEINRLREIDTNFSTLYIKINNTKSRREASAHRYTILLSMIVMVILGAIVSCISIAHLTSLK
ncbi:hypothetical protein ACFL12_03385 [Pseudomonadota bacterium]